MVRLMRPKYLLIATALGEGGVGLLLLISPSIPLNLLLGVDRVSPEAGVLARIAGAALLAVGVACWLGRGEALGPARVPLIAGALAYDTAAAGLLAYAGLSLGLAGVVLWPAVVLHAALAAWCVVCLGRTPWSGAAQTPGE